MTLFIDLYFIGVVGFYGEMLLDHKRRLPSGHKLSFTKHHSEAIIVGTLWPLVLIWAIDKIIFQS